MLLAGKHGKSCGHTAILEGVKHDLGLIGRHHLILITLHHNARDSLLFLRAGAASVGKSSKQLLP